MEAARKELGSGIVIMNVKTVKNKGLAALFRPRQMEVTVALEEESDTVQVGQREIGSRSARGAALEEGQRISGGGEGRLSGRDREAAAEDRE